MYRKDVPVDENGRVPGRQLKRYVLERMAAKDIPSVSELSRAANVGRDTIQAWFRGRLPTPHAGERVARTLGVAYRDLLDARDGLPARRGVVDEETIERIVRRVLEELNDGPHNRVQ